MPALKAIVGDANVLTAAADPAPFVPDWRDRYHGRARAVVRPRDSGEVAAVVRCCADNGIASVPQGGNTGLCGGATPHESGDEV
ncbi:FAD-binding oxidoreductase, partial [Ciceribacter ferrooxidans]